MVSLLCKVLMIWVTVAQSITREAPASLNGKYFRYIDYYTYKKAFYFVYDN